MSDTLIGVIIGGLIASIGTVITLLVDYKKWKSDRKIRMLRDQRGRLEVLFGEIRPLIEQGIESDAFDTKTLSAVLSLCPPKVYKAFRDMTMDEDNSTEKKRDHVLSIFLAMNEALSDIDKEIKNVII